jgi:hypothetical protein
MSVGVIGGGCRESSCPERRRRFRRLEVLSRLHFKEECLHFSQAKVNCSQLRDPRLAVAELHRSLCSAPPASTSRCMLREEKSGPAGDEATSNASIVYKALLSVNSHVNEIFWG